MGTFRLPDEVWLHVFRFLSIPDQSSVRASCRWFMKLIDRPVLWKNTTLYIDTIHSFTSHAWRTLCRRKIASVVVLKASGDEWKQLGCRLPWIHSVTVGLCCARALDSFTDFNNLTRLVVRRCACPSLTSLAALRQLSHLSLCEVVCAPTSDIVHALSQLTNLTSLHYHACSKTIPAAAFPSLLQRMFKLKHLSVNMGTYQSEADFFPPAKHTVGKHVRFLK